MVTLMSLLILSLRTVIYLERLGCTFLVLHLGFLVWELNVVGIVAHLDRAKTIALVDDRFCWLSLK